MEVTVCRALPPTPVQPGCSWPSCPTLGLTMSPGQVLGVHQADLFLPRDVTVQSDGEVVRRQKHLLRWQLHSACADPEGTSVLAAWLMVSRKSVRQHQEAAAPASPLLSLSWGPCPHPCPLPTWAWPPASPGEEEPGAGALPQLWGRPMAVNPEDVVGEAGESSRPQPWEQ